MKDDTVREEVDLIYRDHPPDYIKRIFEILADEIDSINNLIDELRKL